MFASAVLRLRHRVLHAVGGIGSCIKDARTVGKEVANDQVGVTVAVDVGERRCVRVPTSAAGNDFTTRVALGIEFRPGAAWPLNEGDWSSSPVIGEHVLETVFVKVTGQTTHWSHRRRVVRKSNRIEAEWLIARGSARHRRDNDLVNSGVDVTDVVWQSVTVEIVERDRCAHAGDPTGNAAQRWIDVANRSLCFSAEARQCRSVETETFRELRQFRLRSFWYARETVDYEDENDRGQLCSVALDRHVVVTSNAILF